MNIQIGLLIFNITTCIFYTGPKLAKDLWIPNPLTDQLEFFNQTLEELYNSSYDLMAPIQFKEYVISQRTVRWKITKDCEKQRKRVMSIIDPDSKDGNAINVVRFSNTLSNFKPGDKSKAESSQKLIEKLESECQVILKYVMELRSKLFDSDNNVKLWKANELQFLDAKKSSLESLLKIVHSTHSGIIGNVNLLKRKIDNGSDQNAEAKRKKCEVNRTK